MSSDMALRVPPQALTAIQNFLELSDERIQEFLDALTKAGSKFNTNDLAIEISNTTKVPRSLTEGIVQILASLYMAREEQGVSVEKFLDEGLAPTLKPALFQAPKDKPKPDASSIVEATEALWSRLRSFLLGALVLDQTLGTAAKTGPVMTEHEKIFESARILTDVRLIFHPDLSEKPNAAVIVHMLRLATRDLFGAKSAQYFALDTNDIRLLKHLVERAIKKEETLRSLMGSSGVTTIEPKSFF
jgi:hypothetical protein